MPQIGQLFDQIEAFDRPPVNSWQPQETIDFDLRIAANGDWFHEAGIIPRQNLKKLFSTVLALREGAYYLVTPQIRYRIMVDDLPFLAVELNALGSGQDQQIYFRTNMDEVVLADADHPIHVLTDPETRQPAPSVEVRDGLAARLTRTVYYQLVELGLAGMENIEVTEREVGVFSAGTFFSIG